MKCEHTGFEGISSDGIEVDHRNGRYNEPNVLNVETQTIDDFMPLTRRANLFKRGNACNPCKSTGKRYDAKLLGYPISVSEGSLDYDEKLGCVGCYWYSPINFRKTLSQ